MTKQELRQMIRQEKEKHRGEFMDWSFDICARLADTDVWKQSETILLYHALPDEPCTSLLLDIGIITEKQLLLPVVVGDDLVLRKYDGADCMREGAFHIMEPTGVPDFLSEALSSPDRIRRAATKTLLSLYESSNRENLDAGIAAANLFLVTDRPRQAFPILSGIDARLRENPLLASESFDDGRFFFFLGVAADETGHPEIVLDAMERCVAAGGPPALAARNYVAYTLALLGRDLDHALVYARAAVVAEPENPAYLDTLAWVLFRRGDPAAALPHLQQAARLDTENPPIAAHLRSILSALPPDP